MGTRFRHDNSLFAQSPATPSTVNPINRYSLGSDNKDLKYNPVGSLTVYLQADNPGADTESNWLPTGMEPFYTVFRYNNGSRPGARPTRCCP